MTMTNPVRLDPAAQWTLDKVTAWRRLRMPWPAIARNLRQPVAAVKALYAVVDGGGPVAPVMATADIARRAPSPRPAVLTPARVDRAGRKSPGRPPMPPVRLADEMKDVCLAQACSLMAFPEEALERGARGSTRVRILAASGFAHWSNQSKARVAPVFGVRGQGMAPSGLAAYQVPQAMIAALSARLWTLGFRP